MLSRALRCARPRLRLARAPIAPLTRARFGAPIRHFSSQSDAEIQEILNQERDTMEYDVVVVGGGPAGLATAIRLRQLAEEASTDLSVCVVEKGAEVGSHILSGNVFDPKALDELIPDWKEKGAPLDTPVTGEQMRFLTSTRGLPLPVPPPMHNEGNYVISLSQLCRWLGEQAEEAGVEVFAGFAADETLYNDEGHVVGIATKDMGLDKERKPGPNFERGVELRARQTVLAEGCRGSLSERIMDKFDLREGKDVQSYGIGLKEVWEVDPSKHKSGHVWHAVGWPLDEFTYGGAFMYHMDPNLVLVGLVVGLDYANPYLNPYMEFQRLKHHPEIASVLEGGSVTAYGARALNEGGYQALPKLTFPGGVLVGCSAGFMNVPKIKGSHYAMKSGMLAAESIFSTLASGEVEASKYSEVVENSWIIDELKAVRNCKPAFHYGRSFGLVASGVSTMITRGREPWTLHNKTKDCDATDPDQGYEIPYPTPDGKLSFDILTNLQRTNTYHQDTEPSHLVIKEGKEHVPRDISSQQYLAPETRFCPAKVYEYEETDSGPKLVINSQNCIHCKTCDIKMPEEYIQWTVPEGGGGPSYDNL